MDIILNPEARLLLQILLSFFLGSLIGIERAYTGKEAGIRTFSLVCISSTLLTVLSREGFMVGGNVDPSRVAAGIVVGIGFLGSGVILIRGAQIEGLTTASALWATAAVGMAIGCQFYYLAFISALLILIILSSAQKIKDKIASLRYKS